MKLYLVKEDDRLVWVAALAHETMYSYVANTGKFHDNNAGGLVGGGVELGDY
jgi:hypothetical protein